MFSRVPHELGHVLAALMNNERRQQVHINCQRCSSGMTNKSEDQESACGWRAQPNLQKGNTHPEATVETEPKASATTELMVGSKLILNKGGCGQSPQCWYGGSQSCKKKETRRIPEEPQTELTWTEVCSAQKGERGMD